VFFENQSKNRVQLALGAVRQQHTYSRNTWLIADDGDQSLGYFIVGTAIARAIIKGQE
jgi:hypothetical protein